MIVANWCWVAVNAHIERVLVNAVNPALIDSSGCRPLWWQRLAAKGPLISRTATGVINKVAQKGCTWRVITSCLDRHFEVDTSAM